MDRRPSVTVAFVYLRMTNLNAVDYSPSAVDSGVVVLADLVNAVEAIPFVDVGAGNGTYTLTVEGISTAAITFTHSDSATTTVGLLNAALDTAFGAGAIVASGASLSAIILTFSGPGYKQRPIVGHVTVTFVTLTTSIATISGGGTGSHSTTSTAGVGWTLLGKILLGGARKGALLQFDATVAALAHLKLTRAAVSGGAHIDWLIDSAFNTATDELLDAVTSLASSPANIHQIAAGRSSQVKLARLEGVQEIGVYAGGSGSLQMTGTAY